jgi:methionine biosynthesis protein MetW
VTGNDALSLVGRPDFAAIAGWVAPTATVLDLGCGDGLLLEFLATSRGVKGYGIEIADENVLACVTRGVNVIQGDLERGLQGFDAGSFDYVILSQTLQAMRHTEEIVVEMLRVGRQAIVTFPNFGHWQARWQVAFGGRMPVSKTLPYEWYDTPNVHLCTIRDFERFCAAHSIRILERVVLHAGRRVAFLPNLLGSLAVFRFERKR